MLEKIIERIERNHPTTVFEFVGFILVLALLLIGMSLFYATPTITGFDTFNITQLSNNTAPTLDQIPSQNVSKGSEFDTINLHAYVSDAETSNEDLVWYFTDNSNIEIELTSNQFAKPVASDFEGSETITFTAEDEGGLNASIDVTFTVYEEINSPPVFESLNNVTAFEGTQATINPIASDPENEEITFTYSQPFDSEGKWNIPDDHTEELIVQSVTVTANDGENSVDKDVSVFVIDANEPIVNFSVTEISYNSAKIIINSNENCIASFILKEKATDPTVHYYVVKSGKNQSDITKDLESLSQKEFYYTTSQDLANVLEFQDNYEIELKLIPENSYDLYVRCIDRVKNGDYSTKTEFETLEAPAGMTIPVYTTFNGDLTTNFSQERDNASYVVNAVIEKQNIGRIEFTTIFSVNFSGLNLDNIITLNKNEVDLDADKAPQLETDVNIYFYNMSYDSKANIGVMSGDNICESCTVEEYEDGIVMFSASKLGEYTTVNKINFEITDTSTSDKAKMKEVFNIYANFEYFDEDFENEECEIDYDFIKTSNYTNSSEEVSHKENMTYSTSKKYFTYKLLFNETGNLTYTIKCDGSEKGMSTYKEQRNITFEFKAFCGDGNCSNDETCTTCKKDCGECPECIPKWECTSWSECSSELQTRSCTDTNNCGNASTKPAVQQTCIEGDKCSNNEIDDGEEGIDCGGDCGPCPTCVDGIQNQGETGKDCGGPCPACPSCSDGLKNQDEEGIDCGGSCSKKCATIEEPKIQESEEPTENEENENKNKIFIISFAVTIIILGAIGGVGYVKRDYIMDPSGPFAGVLEKMGVQNEKEPEADEGAIHYVQESLMKNVPAVQLRETLVQAGWDTQIVDLSIKQAKKNIVDHYIMHIIPIVQRYDLSNPKVVFAILNQKGYPKEVLKEAIKRVLIQKYPAEIQTSVLPYVS